MSDEPQAKRGRPAFSPKLEHRQLVQVLRSVRATHETIARKLGIDAKTLVKYFSEELEHGEEDTVNLMGSAVVKAGAGGNVAAARYYLETHGGSEWRAPVNVELNIEDIRRIANAARVEAVRRGLISEADAAAADGPVQSGQGDTQARNDSGA